jgi:hypothetical protein
MLIHESPACTPLTASYKKRTGVSETLETTGTSIIAILWHKEGVLESGQIGIKSRVKISKEQLTVAPKKRDTITINTQNYIVDTVTLRANNPTFDDFYDLEVKSESVNPI